MTGTRNRAAVDRPAPEVVHLRTPHYTWEQGLWGMARVALGVGVGYLVIAGILIWIALTSARGERTTAECIASVLPDLARGGLGAGVLVMLVPIGAWISTLGLGDASKRDRRDEGSDRQPDPAAPPAARDAAARDASPAEIALAGMWSNPHQLPKRQQLRSALVRSGALVHHACVVCFGGGGTPEENEETFEPKVFPRPSIQRNNPICLVLPCILGILYFGPRSMLAVIAIGLLMATWEYTFGRFLPTHRYVRLVPGMVEFIRYPMFGVRPPRVRRYPMTAGTIVLALARGHRERRPTRPPNLFGLSPPTPSHFKFTFMRDGHVDVILLLVAQKPAEVCDSIWRAVMSTAPSPRMSETELVG